jgi:hypothetical protein
MNYQVKPKITPDLVKAQVAKLLSEHPELKDDVESLQLSLESETDAIVMCERLVQRETEARSNGLGWIRGANSALAEIAPDGRQHSLRTLWRASGHDRPRYDDAVALCLGPSQRTRVERASVTSSSVISSLLIKELIGKVLAQTLSR